MPNKEDPDSGESPSSPAELTGRDIRRLAAAGMAAVGFRQAAIRAMGLAGTVVLAHLLRPADFGVVAIGLTLISVFGFVGDAGIGAGLIRGQRSPTRNDLAAFLALQVTVTAILAGVTTAVGWSFGLVGQVTGLMVLALPVLAFRTPGVITFERALRYQPLVLIELAETVIYYLWAVATVLAGWGVWGLASATPARAAFGAILLNVFSPVGFVRPQLSWNRVRGLLRFGLQYQAVNAVSLVRDQGMNLGTAAISGTATLGLWSLAYRILQVPFLLFATVWRVSFPAMARLIATGEELRPILERGVALAALITGALLSVLVATTPALVPSLFGSAWTPAARVIPWAALGLMFSGPVSVATVGYLYAVGDSWSVLLSAIFQTLAWLVLAFALLKPIGVEAIGIGWLAASIVEAVVLVVRTRRHTPINVGRHLVVPAALAMMAAILGWNASSVLGPTILSTVAGGAFAGAVYAAGVMVLRRQLTLDALALGRRAILSVGR